MRNKRGQYSVAAEAERILEAGGGLSEREIERFYARVEAARCRRPPKPNEIRDAIEARYRKGLR